MLVSPVGLDEVPSEDFLAFLSFDFVSVALSLDEPDVPEAEEVSPLLPDVLDELSDEPGGMALELPLLCTCTSPLVASRVTDDELAPVLSPASIFAPGSSVMLSARIDMVRASGGVSASVMSPAAAKTSCVPAWNSITEPGVTVFGELTVQMGKPVHRSSGSVACAGSTRPRRPSARAEAARPTIESRRLAR